MIDARSMEAFLAEYFGKRIGADGLDTRLSELGMDSLSLVEFVMDFETRFGIELDVDRLDNDMTLSSFTAMVLQDAA